MDPNIADLFQREGVTFVGKGKKIVDGKQTDEDAIIIGVVEKKPLDKLSKRQIIPKEVGGQKTDIVQTGKIVKRGYEEERRTCKRRPIQPGTSVGHYQITAGTFGAVVYSDETVFEDPTVNMSWWDKLLLAILKWLGFIGDSDFALLAFPSSETKAYILSNNHVLANENKASVGDPIWQPGKYDGGTKLDAVATLTEYVPISKTRPNRVDVAIAEITAEYDPKVLDIGVPKEPRFDIVVGNYITKSGRTTGTTRAKVIATDAYTEVEYDMGLTEWEGQIIVGRTDDGEPSSDGGDSGSIGVDDFGHPVGLLFAGSDEVTVFNPIKSVLAELKTKVSF